MAQWINHISLESINDLMGSTQWYLDGMHYTLNNMLKRRNLSFDKLKIDFEGANKYFGWFKEKKEKKSNSNPKIDTKKFTAVGHSSNWFECEDGVWRKGVPF